MESLATKMAKLAKNAQAKQDQAKIDQDIAFVEKAYPILLANIKKLAAKGERAISLRNYQASEALLLIIRATEDGFGGTQSGYDSSIRW